MAMSPGNQAITGGTVLRTPAIQSPDYVSGVSGWIIRQDGTAEFNSGTFRGSIEVGPLTGQHFIVNNSATGDVIDIYDASNNLILNVTATGQLNTFDALGQARIFGSGIGLFPLGSVPDNAFFTFTQSSGVTGAQLQITSTGASGSTAGQLLIQSSGTGGGAQGATVIASERSVAGSVAVTDRTSTNNLMHAGSYSGTTNATGHVVVNHGCSFIPKVAQVTGNTPGGTFANLTCGVNSLTATQADINWTTANTGAAFANSFISFYATFWG